MAEVTPQPVVMADSPVTVVLAVAVSVAIRLLAMHSLATRSRAHTRAQASPHIRSVVHDLSIDRFLLAAVTSGAVPASACASAPADSEIVVVSDTAVDGAGAGDIPTSVAESTPTGGGIPIPPTAMTRTRNIRPASPTK